MVAAGDLDPFVRDTVLGQDRVVLLRERADDRVIRTARKEDGRRAGLPGRPYRGRDQVA